MAEDMTKKARTHLDELPVETLQPDTDHETESSISSIRKPAKVAFFVGQAAILLTFPVETLAALAKLPTFAEAQANEGLIFSLCAYVPLMIACDIVAWAAFAKKRTLPMLVATLVPLLALAMLVYLAIYTV
jgi:hypothetical protein